MPSYLVVANRSLDSPELAAAVIERIAAGGAWFHVVVPATPATGGITWDEVDAMSAARSRLDEAVAQLWHLGGMAAGEVGSADPVTAVLDAMRAQLFDEIILSTLPLGFSRWLRQDVPSRLRHAVDIPVTVVISTARASARRAS